MKIHLNHEEPPEQDNWPFGFDPKVDSVNPSFTGTVAGILLIFGVVVILISFVIYAFGRDDGRYANSPLKSWFLGLHDKHGTTCCDVADGERVADVDWQSFKRSDGTVGYQVYLLGKWHDVPDDAVIDEPNRAGPAIVWPVYQNDGNGHNVGVAYIRCFIAGAMG